MANENWVQRFATAFIPGSSAFFAPPSVKEPSKADMQRALAYVDPSRLTAQWATTPYNPSWLVTRKGLQIYDSMKRDEQVKAALKFKTDSVLSAGWEVVSPGDQDEDWEVTKFVRDALAFVPGGWNTVLVNALSALAYGFSTQERLYEQKDLGEWKGKLLLTRVQSVKPHFIDFVTDPYGLLLGVTQQLTGTVGDPLPPAKFIIFSHAMEFGNYYGTSDLESAYRAWWVKDNAYKWLAVTLERYGMAPLFAMYDPNSYTGNAVEELKKVVKNIQNASLGVIPRATKDSLELWSQSLNKGSSELFLLALDRFDQHIARAILVPDLVGMSSNTGQSGSLARSRTNFDSFMQVVTQLQNDVAAQVMNAQVIPQLCDLNFPSLQSYPLFRFLPFSDDKKLEIMTTWASLVGGQVVNKIEDDETHIRKVMGFPENEDPEVLPNPQPTGGGDPSKVGPDGKPIVKKPNPFEKKFEDENGVWRTVRGRRIFIREGEDFDSALNRSLGGKEIGSDSEAQKELDALNDKLRAASASVAGNDAKSIARRKKLIDPIVKAIKAVKNRLNPTSGDTIAAAVTVRSTDDGKFDVNFKGDVIGQIERYKYPAFKTVNGAQQLFTKEGWRALRGGEELSKSASRQIVIQSLADAHSKSLNPEKKLNYVEAWTAANNMIAYEDQSEEMRAFAEEHDAVWVEMEDGQRLAVQREEYTV